MRDKSSRRLGIEGDPREMNIGIGWKQGSEVRSKAQVKPEVRQGSSRLLSWSGTGRDDDKDEVSSHTGMNQNDVWENNSG